MTLERISLHQFQIYCMCLHLNHLHIRKVFDYDERATSYVLPLTTQRKLLHSHPLHTIEPSAINVITCSLATLTTL
jgi:hypothetical protein